MLKGFSNDEMREVLAKFLGVCPSRDAASHYFGVSKTALWSMETGSLKVTTKVAEKLGYQKTNVFVKLPGKHSDD